MTITPETIWNAADALAGENRKPTLAAVRQRLGGGSYTTISQAMVEWRAHRQQTALQAREPPPAALGERLSALGGELWALARAQADEQLVGERQRLDAAQAEMRAQLAETAQLADRLAEEADALRRQLAEHQALRTEHETLKVRLAEAERRSAEELARAADQLAHQETAAAEARQAEIAALERAARAEGQVEALQDQLTKALATLRAGAAAPSGPPPAGSGPAGGQPRSAPRRRGRSAGNEPRG